MKSNYYYLGNSRLAQSFIMLDKRKHQHHLLSRSMPENQFELGKSQLCDWPEHFKNTKSTLFISTPPIKDKTVYRDFFNFIKDHFEKVIFISSISAKNESHPYFQAEKFLREQTKLSSLIIRPSGLFDDHTHPIDSIKKYDCWKVHPEEVINLVHREDVARAILFLIQSQNSKVWNQIYQLAYPAHPLKFDYYQGLAEQFQFKIKVELDPNKSIPHLKITDKKLEALGFKYLHPIDRLKR